MATNRIAPPTPGQTALYVGDLHPEVTEAMIFEELKEAGPIVSIRVCRDSVTRRSLGYAYVNFQSSADAERCLDSLNFTVFKGRPCRIMWSQRNPAIRKSNKANIFIKSLHPAIDHKALFDTFSAFGPIISCKVALKPNGESAGYGFVHFEREDSARVAVERVNGMLLHSKQVYVGYFERHTNRLEVHKLKFTNVYVKHLKHEVDKSKLDEVFSKYGAIRSSLVVTKDDGTSKGFAFVNYEEHDCAVKAIDELHDTTEEQNGEISLPNKTLYVARHQRQSERQHLREQWAKERQQRLAKYVNLYIKNLDDIIDDAKLREYFEPFGAIISAKVMRDETGASRGFGFVSFRDSEAANKATSEMHGKIGISTKPLYVGPAQKKEERRLQLEMQFAQRTKTGLYQGPAMQQNPAIFAAQAAAPSFMAQNLMMPSGVPMGQAQQSFVQQMQAQQRRAPPQMHPMMAPRGPMSNMGLGPGMRPAMPSEINRMFPQAATRPQPKAAPYLPQPVPGPAGMKPVAMSRQMSPTGPPNPFPAPAAENQPLTTATLQTMAPDEQKNALGERLFTSISTAHPDLAAKITGMLLEMDSVEILEMLHDKETLGSKVSEALEVLKKHPDEMQAAHEL